MAQLVVRNLPDDVKERLKRRAKQHGRSLEAEVREILVDAGDKIEPPEVAERGFGTRLAKAMQKHPVSDEAWAEFDAALREAREHRLNSKPRPAPFEE